MEDSVLKKYPFIKTSLNKIDGNLNSLHLFFEQLQYLEHGNFIRINIVHIGDSHLQADYFPGMVRQQLQLKYGNAGRGLIAPYKVAKTNEPTSYKSSTTSQWKARRIVFEKDSIPIGISGITIKSDDLKSNIKITTYNQGNLDYSFNKVTLFHQKGMGNYSFNVCDSLNCFAAYINALEEPEKVTSILNLKKANTIILNTDTLDSVGKKTTLIYGLLLENDQAGILYNTIGINGAEYRHYAKNIAFTKQLPQLSPTLIIISLGTNEAYAADYNTDVFLTQVDSLIKSIQSNCPNSEFIITTPGDSFKKRKYKNPNNNKARNALMQYCKQNNLAYWDLYSIMGGYGSINKWFIKGLTSKDKLHLNKKGYELQGLLLYNAIEAAYQNCKLNNSTIKTN